MTTDDDKVSKRYRELPREEPPRHVDDAILAASRRAVHTRPAPLVVPSGRQRWYFPLAAAAIIVLAVAVTVHMEREQPEEEVLSSNTVSAPAAAKEAAPSTSMPEAAPASPERRFEMRDQARAQSSRPAADKSEQDQRGGSGERRERSEPPPRLDLQAPPPPPELQKSLAEAPNPPATARDEIARQSAAGALASRVEPARPQPAPAPQARAAAPRVQAATAEKAESAPKLAASSNLSPEQWLQGIADLRWQGYQDEADRQLAEFRKRYPDYRIPEPMLRRVERPR